MTKRNFYKQKENSIKKKRKLETFVEPSKL